MSASKSSALKLSNSSHSNNSSINNIMNTKYFSTFTLRPLGKEPTDEWSKNEKKTRFKNKHKWKKQTLTKLSETYMMENRGIVCGKHSDIIVVDIDFYDKFKNDTLIPFDRSKSKFLSDFTEDYINKFNTLTFKTGNGGHHLIFKYTPTIKTTTNEEHNIDIRSDNSYIVAPYSVIDRSKYNTSIKKADEKKGEYTVINQTDIQELPIELEAWLRMNLYRTKRQPKQRLKKNTKGEISSVDCYEQDEVDLTEYSYLFDESIMIDILDGLPKTYFKDNSKWYIFTTAMKLLSIKGRDATEMKDLWDQYSSNNGEAYYNEENNNRLWDCCSPQSFMCLEHLLDQSSYVHDAKTMMGYNKLRINHIHTKQHDQEVDLRYLDKNSDGMFFNDIFEKYIICRSDTGTGKTTAFKNYINKSYKVQDGNYKRFISVVSRISLGKEQVKVFKEAGIDCFWHEDIDKWYEYEGENIVITIDSLMKMGYWTDFENYEIYLDEYNSLIEYFVDCPNLCNKRTVIWKSLNKILQEADKVIMTDADISDNSIRFLETLDEINRDDIIYINNKYKHNNGIEASELFSYEELIDLVSTFPAAMVCFDSKNVGEKFVDDMKQKYDINFKYYSSDYTGEIDLDADPYVAFSPKVVYGLDSVMERPVFCYYKGHTISPPAMVQQINRCRKITHLYYLFESKSWKSYKYDNVDEVLFEIQEGKKLVVNYFDETYEKMESQRYDNILASFRFTLDCYDTNKFAHFLRLIQTRGFEIDNELQYNTDKITKSSGLSNKLKEELQGKKAEQILVSWDRVVDEVKIQEEISRKKIQEHISLLLSYSDKDSPEDLVNYISSLEDQASSYESGEIEPHTEVIWDTTPCPEHIHKNMSPMSGENGEVYNHEYFFIKFIDYIGEQIDIKLRELKMKLLNKYLPETWCDIIELISLPFHLIGDEKYNVFLRDPQELERLFRTNNFFNKDTSKLSLELSKKKDFDSQKYQSSQSRFIYTQKLISAVDMKWDKDDNDELEMKMNNVMDKKYAEKLQKEYEITFRTRSKKLDFTQPCHVKNTIVRMMKLMFGKNIINTQATSKSVKIGDKTKTQKITKHFINDEWISLCNVVYQFYGSQKTDNGEGNGNGYEIDNSSIS